MMTPGSEREENQSSSGSVQNGLLGRIVENWLVSANERSFQLPFCQLLAAEGETLIYIARHGAFEKGKDVVTRSVDGILHAYQMKGGNIKQKDWGEIQPQANALVELPVVHPSVSQIEAHRPFLVTNGRIEDEAIDYINTNNISWAQRSFKHPLQVIQRDELVARFLKVHGSFLPKEATDFQRLLTLLLRPGNEPLDKPAFATFVESILPLNDDNAGALTISRAISSLVLLVSYVLSTHTQAGNHWAVIEGWVMVSSYIRGIALKHNVVSKHWVPSFQISMRLVEQAMELLVEECKDRTDFVEGNPLVDGYVYRARQLMLAGLMAAWSLTRREQGEPSDEKVLSLIHERLKEAEVWGESAAPFIFISALHLEQQCKAIAGENLVLHYLQLLTFANAEGNRGIPDSFASIEDSLGYLHQLTDSLQESYAGFSYTMLPSIEYLARRWRRRSLAAVWRGTTRVSLDASIPEQAWEWFRWESESAVLTSSFVDEPQSWEALLQASVARSSDQLPKALTESKLFFICFLLVYPHRLTPSTLAALENLVLSSK